MTFPVCARLVVITSPFVGIGGIRHEYPHHVSSGRRIVVWGRRAAVDEALGSLGVAMLAAGYAVTDAGDVLGRLATMSGRPAWSVGAILSAVLVDDEGRHKGSDAGILPGTTLRLNPGAAGRDDRAGAVLELTPSQVDGAAERHRRCRIDIGLGIRGGKRPGRCRCLDGLPNLPWLAVRAWMWVLGPLLVGTIWSGAQRLPRLARTAAVCLVLTAPPWSSGVSQWWGPRTGTVVRRVRAHRGVGTWRRSPTRD